MQNNITLILQYFFYYKPNLNNSKSIFLKKNKIFLKNFFFLLIFFIYNINKKKIVLNFWLKKISRNKNKLSLIRAPQRNKNSIINIKKEYYVFFLKIIYKVYNFKTNLYHYYFYIKNNFYFFESSLFFLKTIQILFKIEKKKIV